MRKLNLTPFYKCKHWGSRYCTINNWRRQHSSLGLSVMICDILSHILFCSSQTWFVKSCLTVTLSLGFFLFAPLVVCHAVQMYLCGVSQDYISFPITKIQANIHIFAKWKCVVGYLGEAIPRDWQQLYALPLVLRIAHNFLNCSTQQKGWLKSDWTDHIPTSLVYLLNQFSCCSQINITPCAVLFSGT